MLLATTLQSHTEAMPGLPSLGEKRWAHPLPLATIPPGAWNRYTSPCLYAPWHPSHSLICLSLTLAPSTGLAHGKQLSGPGQHLSPLTFSHLNGVLSIVRDINSSFIYLQDHYPQTLGCAMDSPVSATNANLVMEFLDWEKGSFERHLFCTMVVQVVHGWTQYLL